MADRHPAAQPTSARGERTPLNAAPLVPDLGSHRRCAARGGGMSADAGLDPGWLALREPADAAPRSAELADRIRDTMAAGCRLLIHDLGSGTGSMARWLG